MLEKEHCAATLLIFITANAMNRYTFCLYTRNEQIREGNIFLIKTVTLFTSLISPSKYFFLIYLEQYDLRQFL